jgi:hypothetical protein
LIFWKILINKFIVELIFYLLLLVDKILILNISWFLFILVCLYIYLILISLILTHSYNFVWWYLFFNFFIFRKIWILVYFNLVVNVFLVYFNAPIKINFFFIIIKVSFRNLYELLRINILKIVCLIWLGLVLLNKLYIKKIFIILRVSKWFFDVLIIVSILCCLIFF